MRQVCFLPTHRRGDVARARAHSISLVARPVRQHEVADAAGAGISGERSKQEKVGTGRKKRKVPACRVEARESHRRTDPRWKRHKNQSECKEAAEYARDEHGVEDLERALDPSPYEQNRDADE